MKRVQGEKLDSSQLSEIRNHDGRFRISSKTSFVKFLRPYCGHIILALTMAPKLILFVATTTAAQPDVKKQRYAVQKPDQYRGNR